MSFWNTILDYFEQLGQDALVSLPITFFGALLAFWFYEKLWKNWRYGRWELHVISSDPEKKGTTRLLSSSTAERILKDETDLSVFVKGVASPYGWLNIDPCSEESKERGLLVMNNRARTITLDMNKNPEKKK